MFKKSLMLLACLMSFGFAANMDANKSDALNLNVVKNIKVAHKMSDLSKSCVECHAKETPGIVADWKNSRHAHVGVSCMDCHSVNADNPMASVKVHPKDSNGTPSFIDKLRFSFMYNFRKIEKHIFHYNYKKRCQQRFQQLKKKI